MEEIIKKIEDYVKIDNALNSTTLSAFWIKDKEFKFLRYNQAMLNLLYPGAKGNDLIGMTDYEYAKKKGLSDEIVERIKTCCSMSDRYILESPRQEAKFFEKVCDGERTFWLFTTKSRIPPTSNKDTCIGLFGTATLFPNADKIIESNILKLEKLSDSCYVMEE